MSRSDPLGVRYYLPLGNAERWSSVFFWIAAVSSIAALQVEKSRLPILYDAIQLVFVVSVVLFFVIDLAVRLYWSSRAHGKRNSDFVSHAFDVALIAETSKGYFNNKEAEPFRRIAFSVLENAFFSKTILQKMLFWDRTFVGCYALVWLVAVLNRATDLALVTTVAQVIFSEQIISRWVRMEWLRAKFERIYDDTYGLIQTSARNVSKEFQAHTIDSLLRYETSKSQAGISLSSTIFKKNNLALSKQWEAILGKLNGAA